MWDGPSDWWERYVRSEGELLRPEGELVRHQHD